MNLFEFHPFFCKRGTDSVSKSWREMSDEGACDLGMRSAINATKAAEFSNLDAAPPEELFERGVHVLLVVNADADEALSVFQTVVEDGEQRSRRSSVASAPLLADLAVAEAVARLDHLVAEAHGLLVARVVVVA